MIEKTYTLKQLYEYVDKYYHESEHEHFIPAIGDFVDWVASQDETDEEYRYTCSQCRRDFIIWHYIDTDSPMCDECWSKWSGQKKSSKPCKYVSVLPEKLTIHSSRNYRDPDELLDILLETQDAVNAIIDYLKEKNL